MALRYDCKYTETSVVLNNGVDELLAGTLTQIRLRNKQEEKTHRKHTFLTRDCIQVSKMKRKIKVLMILIF